MTERHAMWRHHVLMAILFAGALLAGYLILPGERERIAMLERDGKNREALTLLERRFAGGDRSQRTVYQLQQLYLHFGDLENSRRMLERLAAERPRDAELQSRLAGFYRVTQNDAGYLKALEQRIALRYSEAACRELIGIHRLKGDHVAELAAIRTCRQLGHRRAEDIVRLAHLLAVDGNASEAASILRSVDDVRRLVADRERLLLVSLLIETGQARDAVRRAVTWLKGAQDDHLALNIVEMLVAATHDDLAVQLAREVGESGSSMALAVGELMLDRGQLTAARSYLRGWLEHARIQSPVLASRFVLASLDAEAPELAYSGAQRFGLSRLPQSDLSALAEALSVEGRTAEFDAVRRELKPDTIAGNPLLGAAVEIREGSADNTRSLLTQVKVEELDEWRLALWARLMEQTGRRNFAAQALKGLKGGLLGQRKDGEAEPEPAEKAERAVPHKPPRVRRTPAPQPATAAPTAPKAVPTQTKPGGLAAALKALTSTPASKSPPPQPAAKTAIGTAAQGQPPRTKAGPPPGALKGMKPLPIPETR